MNFKEVAEHFEKINQVSSRIAITKELADLFIKASAEETKIISYMTLGLLRAPYKKTQFNLAEKSVTKVVAQLLGLPSEEVKKQVKERGDLGLVVATGSWQPSQTLSVTDVYEKLCLLEEVSGVGSQEEKAAILLGLLKNVDPLSAQYIIRIVIGALRLGFSDMTLLDAFSWMLVGNKSLHNLLEDAYNKCADIGLIAYTAKVEGQKGLEQISITVGIPIRPAAAERLPSAAEIIKKIGPCFAQPKIDGFRLQVHIDNRHKERHMWFFSRNLQDMTGMFPDLKRAFSELNVKSLIVEGEAIAFQEETHSFVPFQETVKRKRKHGIEEIATTLPLKCFIFDILYLNDQPILGLPQTKRQILLEELFPRSHQATLSLIDQKVVSTAQELEEYFFQVIEDGLEGLVVKRMDASYQPGKRNFNWIKYKRQAGSHLEDTVDTVILGYYKGRGKRSTFGIGAFLVGLYNKHKDCFETVAKVGTGLKDEDWKELKKRCDEIAVHEQPRNVVCAKELMPDVWVHPHIVCAILADEITISPLHTAGKTAEHAGYALRFPRFMGYRPDKNADQATTIDEIKGLYKHQR